MHQIVFVKGTKVIQVQTALLVLGFILMLVATVSAPYTPGRYILEVATTKKGKGTFRFGPLGWCIVETATCSRPQVSYDISGMLHDATGYRGLPAGYSGKTQHLVLIPITAVIAILSAILTALSTAFPVLDGALVAGWLSSLLSIAALATEWTLFGPLRAKLEDNAAVRIRWGATHTVLIAAAVVLLGCPVVGTLEWVRARRRARDRGVYEPLRRYKNVPYQF